MPDGAALGIGVVGLGLVSKATSTGTNRPKAAAS